MKKIIVVFFFYKYTNGCRKRSMKVNQSKNWSSLCSYSRYIYIFLMKTAYLSGDKVILHWIKVEGNRQAVWRNCVRKSKYEVKLPSAHFWNLKSSAQLENSFLRKTFTHNQYNKERIKKVLMWLERVFSGWANLL